MSDTTTITPDERAEWRERLTSKFSCFDTELGGFTLRLLTALEQAEARAEQDLAHCKFEFDRAEKAEARVKARNKHIHTLMCEALENERNLDGMKSRWQAAEADNARLTKMVGWLADKVGDAYGKPCDKDLAFTNGECPMGHIFGDDCCIQNCKYTCWVAEAARRAVADAESEGKR